MYVYPPHFDNKLTPPIKIVQSNERGGRNLKTFQTEPAESSSTKLVIGKSEEGLIPEHCQETLMKKPV